MSGWKKFVLSCLIFAGFFFTLGFFVKYHLPRIKTWLLVEIERQSNEKLPVRIWAKRAEIYFLPLEIVISDIQILPKRELKSMLAPMHAENFRVRLNWFALFRGEVRLSLVQIDSPQMVLILEDNPFKQRHGKKIEPIRFNWEEIVDFPIDEFVIQNLSLYTKIREQGLALHLKEFSASIENRYDAILAGIDAPSIQFKQLGPHPDLNFSLETRFLVEPREIQLAALKIKREHSFFVGSGKVAGNLETFEFDEGSFNFRGSADLTEIPEWVEILFGKTSLPKLQGKLSFDTEVRVKPQQVPELNFLLQSENLGMDHYQVAHMKASGSFKDNHLNLSQLDIQDSSIKAHLKNFHLNTQDPFEFSGEVEGKEFFLERFLHKNLGLHALPLTAQFKGQFPCKGKLKPEPLLQCEGSMEGKDLHLWQEEDHSTLVKLSQMAAQGNFKVNTEGVFYKADLQVGQQSKGSSEGKILYETGFQIQYKADKLAFSDLESLVDLKLEGAGKIEGQTEGDSQSATMQLNFDGEEIWFEDYLLGNLQSEVRYKSGILTFRKILGSIGSTRYEGHMSINLPKGEMLLDSKIPFADLDDVKNLLSRTIPMPFPVSGTGSGNLKVWGPLDFKKSNYTLNSSFYRGTVAREGFDEFVFKVKGENGVAKSDQIHFVKGESRVETQGTIQPEGEIDAVVVGRDLRLEQSENLRKIGIDMTGKFDFTMALRGLLPNPKIDLNGRLSKLLVGDKPSDDSTFRLIFDKEKVVGSGSFIGQTVTTRFKYPLVDGVPLEFHFQSKKWDFTRLFQMLSQSAQQRDFQTKLTSKIDLKAENGKFWSSSGRVLIEELELRRATHHLSNTQPMILDFENGRIDSRNFQMEGEDAYLKLESKGSTADSLNASLNGKMDMALIALLTPFLEDLRGPISFNANFSKTIENPQILGSAYIDSGYVKLEQFPHPFEKVRADILFNQKNILVNALTSEMAGGRITADGKIRPLALNHVPVDLRGHFKDVHINFPEGMQSKGSGTLSITGDFFPYKMGMTYDVVESLVTMEFSESKTGVTEIRPSTYLPKFLTEEEFQAFVFDLDLKLVNPSQIKNSMVDAKATGNLKIYGPADTPLMTGTLTPLPGGKLSFRENLFEILTGYVEYKNDPPENPTIYVSAQSRVTEVIPSTDREIRTDYDIRLLIQGPVKDMKFTMESQPPLSDREIVSLLALGMTGSTTGQDTLSKDQQSGAAPGVIGTQIGAQLFETQFGRQFKDKLGVDFKIGTSFNTEQNASYPKVTFSKQWTPKFETSASRTIEPSPTSDVKLEYKLNTNTSAIGFWEGKQEEASQATVNKDTENSKIGIDLEYKVEFK